MKKILIASDHAGFELKQQLIKENPQLPWEDLGPSDTTSVDYPDFAQKLCDKLISETGKVTATDDAFNTGICGILICGSGQGMAIKANKYSEIRAALCWNEEIAKLSRQHNNANVLCMGARTILPEMGQKILKAFLGSAFEGGRHSQRVAKLC